MKQTNGFRKDVFLFKRFSRKTFSAFASMHKVVNIGVVMGCVLTAVPSTGTFAQSTEGNIKTPEMELQELEEVMVTASRVETPVNQTAKLVTVLNKEQIQQAPVQSIQDLLVYAANIDVVQRSGHGVQADISIRGGTKDQTAILLNGINLSNSHTGFYSFNLPVNLSDIERVEIIHGPSALVYGSSAFAGGINIVTKKKVDAKGYARLEGGMHNLRGMEMRGAFQSGIATTSLSAGSSSSDGHAHNTDYNLYNILLQSRLQFAEHSKVDFMLGFNDKQYGANSFYSAKHPNQHDETRRFVGTAKGEFGTTLKFIPILYWVRHYNVYEQVRGTDQGKNHHKGDTHGTNLILQYASTLGTTSLGGEFRREDIMSSLLGILMSKPHGIYTKYKSRVISSATLEHTAQFHRFTLSAGFLMNHTTLEKGIRFYPSASIAYRPTNEINIFSTWGKSTRLPSFTDLYYTNETHEADVTLKPERSQALDLGIKYRNSQLSAYVTGYMLWGRNIIDWVSKKKEDGTPVFASWNHTEVNTRGIETGVSYRLGELLPVLGEHASLSLNYARMRQDSDTKGENSLFKLNYLRDKFTTTFNHHIYKGFSAGWYFRLQKRMGGYTNYVNAVNVGWVPFKTFSTLDVKLNYRYQDLALHLNLNNLYDTRHNDVGVIPQPGFWLTGGISYIFK